ncbi:MAG TPA: helix-turn-helix transcriptional regulator [Devosia sp.]
MPRPKLVSDTDVLDATRRVMLREGAGFTLADVATEVGLSRAALIQRFENKTGLARQLAAHNRSALEALIAADPIDNKGPQRVLAFLDRVLEAFAPPVLLADAATVAALRDAVVARLDEPSRQRAGEVADLLLTVLQGAAAAGDRTHVAGRLRLALKLVYAGRPD